jgi:hypothetical protein
MIQHTGTRVHRFVVIMTALLISGCASPAFDGRATDFNRSMADTSEKQIVLNILRAAASKPLYFTTISNVDSREVGEVDVDFDVPIGPGASGFTLLPSIGINDSTPRFTVSALMNATFIRAMLRPVELGIFERMMGRHYNDELVMRLFVREIGWESEPLLNAPETFEKSAFRRRLRLLAGLGLATEPLLGDNTLIEDLDQDDMLELVEGIEAIATPRLSIVPDRITGKFDIIGEPGGFRLCFRRPPILDIDALSDKQIARAIDLTCRLWVVSQLTRADLGGRDLKRLDEEEKVELIRAVEDQIERNADFLSVLDAAERADGDDAGLDELVEGLLSQSESGAEDGVGEQELGRLEHFGGLAVTIRSPMEMFDFLGQLHRETAFADGPKPTILPDRRYRPQTPCPDEGSGPCAPLRFFALEQGTATEPGAVVVNGRGYSVPDLLTQRENRSIETVGVLSDLTSIFIESDEVDGSARVTVLP